MIFVQSMKFESAMIRANLDINCSQWRALADTFSP